MTTKKGLRLLSVNDYLAFESLSPNKHEFVAGQMYPMKDFTNRHNVIAGNLQGSLHGKLRNGRFHLFNSQTKLRIRLPTEYRFYYPDCSVVGRQNLTIPSLLIYALVQQVSAEVVIHRRTETGFVAEV